MPKFTSAVGRGQARVHLVRGDGGLPEPTDADLVRAARRCESSAEERIWVRYSVLARRVLRRMLGPGTDVEDALQEVFLRLFRDLDGLRDESALRSYLIGIALHVAGSELRKRRVRRFLSLSPDGALPEQEPQIDGDGLHEREALRRLYLLLDRVSTRTRLVFVLRHVEGLELGALSAVLGCSLATTKRRVAEASERVCKLAAEDPLLAPYLEGKA